MVRTGAQGADRTRMPSMNNAEIVESIKDDNAEIVVHGTGSWPRPADAPDATPEELFRAASEAMNRSLR